MDVIMEYRYTSEEDKIEKMKDLMKAIKSIMEENKYKLIDIEKLAKITTLSFGDIQHYAKLLNEKEIVGRILYLNRSPMITQKATPESFIDSKCSVNGIELNYEHAAIINEYMDEYNLPKNYGVVKSVSYRLLKTGDVYTDNDFEDQVQYQKERIVFIAHQKEINDVVKK